MQDIEYMQAPVLAGDYTDDDAVYIDQLLENNSNMEGLEPPTIGVSFDPLTVEIVPETIVRSRRILVTPNGTADQTPRFVVPKDANRQWLRIIVIGGNVEVASDPGQLPGGGQLASGQDMDFPNHTGPLYVRYASVEIPTADVIVDSFVVSR